MFYTHRVRSIDEQRKVELTLIDFLRGHCPEVYKLWSTYGDAEVDESDYSDTDDETSTNSDSENSSSDVSDDNITETTDSYANVNNETNKISLRRRYHTDYLISKLGIREFACAPFKLYASQPWLVYWTLQATNLLGISSLLYTHVSRDEIASFLLACLSKAPSRQCRRTTHYQRSSESEHSDNINLNVKETEDSNNEEQIMMGFAGSVNGDEPHLASTYAACCALCLLYDETAGNRTTNKNTDVENQSQTIEDVGNIDGDSQRRRGNPYLHLLPRIPIKRWLLHLRNDMDGSFYVHDGGEADIRASYCVAVIVALLDLDNPESFACSNMHLHNPLNEHEEYIMSEGESDKIITCNRIKAEVKMSHTSDLYVRHATVLDERAALFVARCQTHEGGFTCSNDGSEAHGAYTQCGLASLLLMRKPQLINIASARRWLSARQMTFDAGFNGRTNKLVDSCYSYWIGSSHALLRIAECYVKMLNLNAEDDSNVENVNRNIEEESKLCPCTYTQNAPFMLAKEILLLDLAQLVDASQIAVMSNSRWDAAEKEEMCKVNMVNSFLRTNDKCLQVAMEYKSRQAKAWHCLECNSVSERNAVAPISSSEGINNNNITKCDDNEHQHDEVKSTRHDNVDCNKLRSFLYEEVGDYYYNQRLLQEYVFACCQDIKGGGLKDKPECYPDSYHTCYSLSGVSLAQNLQYTGVAQSTSPYIQRAFAQRYLPGKVNANVNMSNECDKSFNDENNSNNDSTVCDYWVVLPFAKKSNAAETSVLRLTNPLFNIHPRCVRAALQAWTDKTTVECRISAMEEEKQKQ